MGIPPVDLAPMTVEEFFAFTDTRPDNEKWELIDGEPTLNATPTGRHQLIVANLISLLRELSRKKASRWVAIPGIGVRVSDNDLPEPDVLVRPRDGMQRSLASRECDDAIVAFEILSPSTKDRDLRWKRPAYLSLPSLKDYVVIAQDKVEVAAFTRESRRAERRLDRLDSLLDLPALSISLPLSEIYRDTGLE